MNLCGLTRKFKVNMRDAVGLDYTTDKGFVVRELLRTDSTDAGMSWKLVICVNVQLS